MKEDSYRTGKYTVLRRVRTSFSPEILQAGEEKGLNKLKHKETLQYGITVNVLFVLAVTLCVSRNIKTARTVSIEWSHYRRKKERKKKIVFSSRNALYRIDLGSSFY